MSAIVTQSEWSEGDRKILAFPRCPTLQRAVCAFEPSAEERVDLDRLRWLALRSLIAPKPDLERACFLLAGETHVSLERYSIAFFRGLADKARRPMAFYRPGTRGISDDEMWLLRLVAARRRGDDAGAAALVAWRVTPEGQRWLRFLCVGMVRVLDSVN